MKTIVKTGFLSAAICLGLTACSSAAPDAAAADTALSSTKATTLVTGQNAHGYAKPGAPVTLRHDFDGKLQAGQVGEMNIDVLMTPADASVSVSYSASEGLNIISGGALQSFDGRGQAGETGPNAIGSQTLRFQAAEDGRYSINAFINVDYSNGLSLGRALSISVPVGNAPFKSKSNGTRIETSGGRSIAVMPAQETITQ